MAKAISRKKATGKVKVSQKSVQKKIPIREQKGGFEQSFRDAQEKNPEGFKALQRLLARRHTINSDPTPVDDSREPIIGFSLSDNKK